MHPYTFLILSYYCFESETLRKYAVTVDRNKIPHDALEHFREPENEDYWDGLLETSSLKQPTNEMKLVSIERIEGIANA